MELSVRLTSSPETTVTAPPKELFTSASVMLLAAPAASDVVPVTSNLPDWLMTPPVERTRLPEAEEGPLIPRAFVSASVTLAPLNMTFAKLLFKGRLMLPVAVSVARPDGVSVAVPD